MLSKTFSMLLVAFIDIFPPMLSFKGVLAWVTVNFLTGETLACLAGVWERTFKLA